ncbi:hypothetical protein [Aquimarina litoralis]|uniref:hypothetical protein n=1 Tax=Aquimarina litoralis TaxID=584605 RepID=UPI001C588A43|nr:hypothetical protein [Aquimarina litoralis]MBW1299030.1 hypothetical protein [Aquimarina litoralis]
MDFFNYTQNWIKGELFEATIISIFSILLIVSGVLFWKFGTTPSSKSLILPLIVVGFIFISAGTSMYFSNKKRLIEYKERYTKNKSEFVMEEKQRVEGFQYMYTVTKVIATLSFIITLIAFWFTKNYTFQGIALGFAILGTSGLVIDYFSEERANTYYKRIELALDK